MWLSTFSRAEVESSIKLKYTSKVQVPPTVLQFTFPSENRYENVSI